MLKKDKKYRTKAIFKYENKSSQNSASKAEAVKVVRYDNNKRIVVRHIGSAHTKTALNELLVLAEEWIKDYSK